MTFALGYCDYETERTPLDLMGELVAVHQTKGLFGRGRPIEAIDSQKEDL